MLARIASRRFTQFLPKDVVIVAAKRTPIGSFMGALSTVPATQLGAHAIKAALEQAKLTGKDVEEVIMGTVIQAGQGQAPARNAALKAGLPQEVVCTTINKVCASGMKAVMMAAQTIALGQADVIVAGGMENMSLAPYLLPNYRTGQLMGHAQLLDSITYDALTCAFGNNAMGDAAEETVKKFGITREAQDAFCIESYRRTAEAWKRGFMNNEVVSVTVESKKGKVEVQEDEEFKKIKADKVPTLRPVFRKDGTITAANASKINDGAAAIVVMSAEKAKKLGAKPLARIVSFADNELEPVHFSMAPIGAMEKALRRANLEAKDLDLSEVNEAFSSVALVNMKTLGLDHSRVNINGGAVSLGHPVGMSGARITGSLIYALQETGGRFGGAGICNGGGGASAIILEKLY
jgi:acetyl-CoA C-acetyltransferase